MSSKAKPTYKEGADGKLYFTFAVGAVYELRPKFGKPFLYKIATCELDNGTEYYRIESAGKELPTRFTVSEIEKLLGRLPSEQVAEGELAELPLLKEEVQAFYSAKQKELNKANVAENAKLKGTAYYKNITALAALNVSLRLAKSAGDDEKTLEFEEKIAELQDRQSKLLQEKQVNVQVLRKVPECEKCKDTGLSCGQICACAYVRADEIKAFNALSRLSLRV